MTLSLIALKHLKSHLQQKIDNHFWLSSCIEKNFSSFPYRVKETALGSIERITFRPQNKMTFLPIVKQDSKPLYVVNIPMTHLPGQEGYQHFKKLASLLKNESFGKNAKQSQKTIKRQLSLVIGVNQIRSLDSAKNRTFLKYMSNFPKIEDIACRIFGFFWHPFWEKTEKAKGKIYPCEKAFLLLKLLSKKKAETLRRTYESSDSLNPDIRTQIPFQLIREKIKNSIDTTSLVQHFHDKTAKSPIYFGVMDADCIHLRTNEGLFSRFDKAIASHNIPSVISLGYSVADDERVLIRLGVTIDMKVREAMTSVFPYGAYFPEPGSLFCIRRPHQITSSLSLLTFKGPGSGLENRRLIQSGLSKKIFDQNTCFLADRGVTTRTPSRMKTKKNGKVEDLSSKVIKQKQYLKSLRDVSQTHATPKQWADNLYIGLGFSYSQVTDVTTPMMYIFNVFDPLSRMFAHVGRYSCKIFDEIIDNYDNQLSEENKNLLATARGKLYNLKMPKKLIDQIEEAARKSGQAIFNELCPYRH